MGLLVLPAEKMNIAATYVHILLKKSGVHHLMIVPMYFKDHV